MSKYTAFLRGINVGGHKIIKMDELKNAFQSFGYENVKTLLASGNVVFEARKTNVETLKKNIEANLKIIFGHEINVLIRAIEELEHLSKENPFKGVMVTPQTRLYVTFLNEKFKGKLKIPYESPDKNFKIVHISAGEVCSVITLSPNYGTIDLMDALEKEFGKKITTRNWNTIVKILKI